MGSRVIFPSVFLGFQVMFLPVFLGFQVIFLVVFLRFQVIFISVFISFQMIFLPVFLIFQVIGKDARKTTARRLWCILIHSRKYAHVAGRRAELTQGHPKLVPRRVQVVRQTADLASKTAQDGPRILQLGL